MRLHLAIIFLAAAPAAVTAQSETAVTTRAQGTFEVKMTPAASDTAAEGEPLGRFTLDKHYHGDLDANSKGEMLSAGSPQSGSAGYVAVERVTGKLSGRSGTFALQHSGTMHQGTQDLRITVVPGSGTNELTGIAGSMKIIIAEGKHSYELDYTLAKKH